MSRVRFLGSAALALAYVARGAIDCFQMDHLQPWDVAAGVLIICEAGGTVIDTKGALIKWVRERKNLFFLDLKERLLHVILRYFNIFLCIHFLDYCNCVSDPNVPRNNLRFDILIF